MSPVALVTGALTGIGRATATAFARNGYRVVVSGRRENLGLELVQSLRELRAEAEFMATDVREEDQVRRLMIQVVTRFGRIDAAVNAAGTEGRPGPIVEQTAENYEMTFATNVLGTFLCMKYELLAMQRQGYGSIVNVSSILGKCATPGMSMYTASKHAVEGLTKTAAIEAAPFEVRVNAVAPGPIDTQMLARFADTAEKKAGLFENVPLKRLGTPDEVAQAIVFLASSKASFITGSILDVDGGRMVRDPGSALETLEGSRRT